MEIRKARAGAHGGMLSPGEARGLGLGPEAPEPYPCPHCGKALERRGVNVGDRVLWVSHVACGCPGEREEAERQALLDAEQREQERRERLGRVGIGQRYFDAVPTDPTCAAFVESYAPLGGMGLFIHGPVGTGKTHNASAVAARLALEGRGVMMTSALRILSDVRETYNTGTSAKRELEQYLRCEVLVLDDLGTRRPATTCRSARSRRS